MSIFTHPKIMKRRRHGERDGPPPASSAMPPMQVHSATEPVVGEIEQELRNAAWEGFIPTGLVQRGYHVSLAAVAQQRAANAMRQGDLTDQLHGLDAELEALVVQPVPPPPEPKVLRTLSTILPFNRGDKRHG